MTDLTPRLVRLGDALEAAARSDLRPRRRRSRRLAVAVVAALIAVPGAAVAGIELISEDDVARSLPAGTLSLAGTEPDCTVVRQDVEYHCVLARPPAPEIDGFDSWMGAAEPTVDASKHVNGGCRSLNAEGTEWSCYIGEEAVRQQIIAPGFLGEYAPAPGVG
jgi:hypothetical protein